MEALVNDLHVMFTQQSFENLVNVATHPTLSRYVLTVHYDAVILSDVDRSTFDLAMAETAAELISRSYSSAEKGAPNEPQDVIDNAHRGAVGADEGNDNLVIESKKILDDLWEQYTSLQKWQEGMIDSEYAISMLATALSRFMSLKHLAFNCSVEWMSYQARHLYRKYRKVKSIMLNGRRLSHGTLPTTAVPLATLPSFRSLVASLENWELFYLWNTLETRMLSPLFAKLGNLDLCLPSIALTEHEDHKYSTLSNLLEVATGLRSLALRFAKSRPGKGDLVDDDGCIKLAQVLKKHTWQHLREFLLEDLTIADDFDVVDFIRRHHNVRRIYLYNVVYIAESTTYPNANAFSESLRGLASERKWKLDTSHPENYLMKETPKVDDVRP